MTEKHPRDPATGRYVHEWGVVGQCWDPYVEIYQCQLCHCFNTSEDGNKMLTSEQLRKKYPNAKEVDSGQEGPSLYLYWDPCISAFDGCDSPDFMRNDWPQQYEFPTGDFAVLCGYHRDMWAERCGAPTATGR